MYCPIYPVVSCVGRKVLQPGGLTIPDVIGFASKVEFNTFSVIRVIRVIRGSVLGCKSTIHEIHETH